MPASNDPLNPDAIGGTERDGRRLTVAIRWIEAEGRKLRKELDRFPRAIAGGTAPASVLAEITRRETRLAEIERERAALTVEAPSELQERRLRKAFAARLGQFADLLQSNVSEARQVLRKIVVGRIEFRPVTH